MPVGAVTSAQIAEALDIDPTQVRRDFGSIGVQGMGRVGFAIREVCRAIRVVVGFDQRVRRRIDRHRASGWRSVGPFE